MPRAATTRQEGIVDSPDMPGNCDGRFHSHLASSSQIKIPFSISFRSATVEPILWVFLIRSDRHQDTDGMGKYNSHPLPPFRPYLPRWRILATCSLEFTSNRTRFNRSVTVVVTSLPTGKEYNPGGYIIRKANMKPTRMRRTRCSRGPEAWLCRLSLASGPDWRKDSNSSVSTHRRCYTRKFGNGHSI